jgi:eukaryotic-like serine/threonine-protein kinase
VRQAERMVELEPKLADILRGGAFHGDARDRLVLADLCCKQYRYATAARFFGEAVVLDPKLAGNHHLNHRYNAACCAALAAAGQGKDAATLTCREQTDFRRRALGWLRDELATARAMLEREPEWVAQSMRYWQDDPDFAGVRGEAALAALPEAERAGWRRLWQDVERLRQQAVGSARK